MSKSYRRPYSAVCGSDSAAWDKYFAHRGVRRSQKLALKMCSDWDEFLIPHKYECSHNEVYGWSRDGNQTYRFPPHEGDYFTDCLHYGEEQARKYFQQSLEWYERLKRK